MPDPLIGDEQRRAGPTIRGFVYQLWRSVQAWIDLKDGEVLFVEGAEDLDIVAEKDALAEQVKDNKKSGNLTLGSKNAITSLNSFWEIFINNPHKNVRYKYLTTAGIGKEKNGFGGNYGIRIWETCGLLDHTECTEDLEMIKSFLLKKSFLSHDLKSYLKAASLNDYHQNLKCLFP